MKLGVVITMYDEYDLVFSSIKNIRVAYPDARIVVVQSSHQGSSYLLNKIKELANKFIILPDLSQDFHRTELPSRAVCRNISEGCNALISLGEIFDLVAIFTGDTLITDASSFQRRRNEMFINGWYGMVSQAIGHRFHADTDNPPEGIVEGRYQSPNITDFACCFFVINGIILQEKKAFCNIKITNKWTSEQCLGDEMVRIIGGDSKTFHRNVGILNKNQPNIAYSYADGIIYHAKTKTPSR